MPCPPRCLSLLGSHRRHLVRCPVLRHLVSADLAFDNLEFDTWHRGRRSLAGTTPLPCDADTGTGLAPSHKIAPGPRGSFAIGNLLEFRNDVLRLLLNGAHEFGDVVRFRLGPMIVHLVNHPDHIRHVLLARHDIYNKDTRSSSKIRSITGEGLLTSNGEFWLQRRRLMQPTFSPQRLTRFVGVMTQATSQMLERWAKWAEQGRSLTRFLALEMMTLTFTIVGKALLAPISAVMRRPWKKPQREILEHTWHRLEKLIELPEWFPSRRNRRFRRGLHALDRIVHRLITERRQSNETSNVCSALLLNAPEETADSHDDAAARNETNALLLAGHENGQRPELDVVLLSQHLIRRRSVTEIAAVLD